MRTAREIRGVRGLVIAAIALVVMMAVFVITVCSLYDRTVGYARRDLKARAELAALVLEEPLRTQDFKRIREFADDCRAKGIRFLIRYEDGVVFGDDGDYPGWAEGQPCAGYRLVLSINGVRMLMPFFGALLLALFAFLVGIVGMVFVFFAFYRQRAHLAELERIERERREFVADFSHELKTPLTGLIGAADLLADAPDPAAVPRLAGMIARESRRLNSLARQILDLSRLEGAGSGLGAVSAAELVERAIAELVENARRHSGSDDITVREETVGGFRRWIVEDRGIGVPPEQRERIFERFYRVDPSRSEASGGAGLGLAIVRRIARNLGGDCIMEAAEPRGSRFVFSVPVAGPIAASDEIRYNLGK